MKYYVDFIAKSATHKLNTLDKIKMILHRVRQKRVLIIEEGLTPAEEAELIKQTMMVIDFDTFFGVEFFNWQRNSADSKKVLKRTSPAGTKYTVIAPSDAVQIIENTEELLSIELVASV